MPYTLEEARRRIPFTLRSLALAVIDAAIILDNHPVDSVEFENAVHAIEGDVGQLSRLFYLICKEPKERRRVVELLATP